MNWNGLPQNPERDGWHWLRCNLHANYAPEPWFWISAFSMWDKRDGDSLVTKESEYLGPAAPPAEIARLRALLDLARREIVTLTEAGCQRLADYGCPVDPPERTYQPILDRLR